MNKKGFQMNIKDIKYYCALVKTKNFSKVAEQFAVSQPTITLAIIMIVSKESPKMPPWLNGTLRFVESAVGVAIGVATIWAYEHIHKLLVKVFAPRPKPEKSV